MSIRKIDDAQEGELMIHAIKEGVKGAVIRQIKTTTSWKQTNKNCNIMLVFTVGTLLFVRTVLVYGASDDNAAETTPLRNELYQTRLSEDTFERLKTVTLVIQPQSDQTILRFRLMNTDPATQDDNLVQNALGAWAAAIEFPIRWQRDGTFIAQKDILRSRQEIERSLGPVIVWKDTSLGQVNHHLIIRQVDSNTYEWMEVYQPDPEEMLDPAKTAPEPRVELCPVGFDTVQLLERWRFVSDGRGGKRLTEICSTFAEQRMQEWLCSLDEILQEMQEDPTTRKLEFLQGIRRRERERLLRAKEIARENDDFERKMIARMRPSQIREENLENQRAATQRLLDENQKKYTRDLEVAQAQIAGIKRQTEEQLQKAEAERSSMIAQLEAYRVREENQENQKAETQQQLDKTQQQLTRNLVVAQAQIADIKRQMDDQIQRAEAERSSMMAQLEAYRVREDNHESRRAEAQHQLEECQRAAIDSEQEFNRKEKENSHWMRMVALIGGSVMLLVIGILIFVLCRRAGRGMIETSENMKRELGKKKEMRHPLPNRSPGFVAIDVAQMDPQFGCSRDPQVAALRHSILADENGQFGINVIEEVTEQEGIDVSSFTRKSTIGNAEEGESPMQAMQEGVKEAVIRQQRKQMYIEPLKEIVQNAVVVQEEVMDEIVEIMETDKAPQPQSAVD